MTARESFRRRQPKAEKTSRHPSGPLQGGRLAVQVRRQPMAGWRAPTPGSTSSPSSPAAADAPPDKRSVDLLAGRRFLWVLGELSRQPRCRSWPGRLSGRGARCPRSPPAPSATASRARSSPTPSGATCASRSACARSRSGCSSAGSRSRTRRCAGGRRWVAKSGPVIARGLPRRQARPGRIGHLDEVQVSLRDGRLWPWRAVDEHGVALGEIPRPRRDRKAAKRRLAAPCEDRRPSAEADRHRGAGLPRRRPGARSRPASSTGPTRGSATGHLREPHWVALRPGFGVRGWAGLIPLGWRCAAGCLSRVVATPIGVRRARLAR